MHQDFYYSNYDGTSNGSPTSRYPMAPIGYYARDNYHHPIHYDVSCQMNRSTHQPYELHQPISVHDESLISPHKNDVLMGRGGKNNQHSGNEKLRNLARTQCSKYRVSSKKGKSAISREIVQLMRDLQPPARFLKRDGETGAWVDVGDDIAREKASQVLRDAVALLQEGALFPGNTTEPTPEDGGTSPQADDCQDETPSAKQLAREPNPERNPSHHDSGIDSMITPHYTPSLIDSVNTSASFPPPRPLEISRKRHRQNLSDDDQLLIHTAQGDEWLISQGVDEWSQSPSQRRRSNPDHGFIQEASKGPRWYSDSRYETPNACSSATLRSRDMNSSRTYSGSSPLRPRDDPPQYHNPSQYHRTSDGYMVLPTSAYHPHPHSIHRRPVPIPEYSSPPPFHVAHPQHQRHKASTNSHNLGWKQPNRPQSIAAARQASTASCGSLFGEVGNHLGFSDFDLFNWELLDDGNGNNEMQPKKGTSASASPR